MTAQLPDYLKQGEPARLFPIVAETSKERRIVSTFLASLTMLPELAGPLLASVDQRIGKRTKIDAYTEVIFTDQKATSDRPDGLIVVNTGRTTWRALIEAKIGQAELTEDQLAKYVEIARAHGIDAVITISNQFVARADHHPIKLSKSLLRKTQLFHWPWMWIFTQAALLKHKEGVEDAERVFLTDELIRFLSHPSTGIVGFNQMGKSWKEIVRAVATGQVLRKADPGVAEAVGNWLEEQRDMCLILSRHVGEHIELKIERKLRDDPAERLRQEVAQLIDSNTLTLSLLVPNAASDIDVSADLTRKAVSVAMKVRANTDYKSTKARLNWQLRQIKQDDPRLFVRASWPGRIPDTQARLSALREDPDIIQPENSNVAPHSLQIMLIEECGGRFNGSRTFIEDVERIVPEFYDLVGQHVRAFQPAPPKPVASKEATPVVEVDDEEDGNVDRPFRGLDG